jgi:hypothetical protein
MLGQRPAVLLPQRRQQADRDLLQQQPGLGAGEQPGHLVDPPGQLDGPLLDLLRHIINDHIRANIDSPAQIPDPQLDPQL